MNSQLTVYKASAGSGKTFTLAKEYMTLVIENPMAYRTILAVTFTNKAANEMRQRIHNLTGDNDTGYINTFHGFCVSILQEDSHAVGYPKSFLVLDNSDIDAMLQIIYDERGLTLRDMTFSHARDMIEMLKLKERPDYYEDMTHPAARYPQGEIRQSRKREGYHLLRLSVSGKEVLRARLQRPDRILSAHFPHA